MKQVSLCVLRIIFLQILLFCPYTLMLTQTLKNVHFFFRINVLMIVHIKILIICAFLFSGVFLGLFLMRKLNSKCPSFFSGPLLGWGIVFK